MAGEQACTPPELDEELEDALLDDPPDELEEEPEDELDEELLDEPDDELDEEPAPFEELELLPGLPLPEELDDAPGAAPPALSEPPPPPHATSMPNPSTHQPRAFRIMSVSSWMRSGACGPVQQQAKQDDRGLRRDQRRPP